MMFPNNKGPVQSDKFKGKLLIINQLVFTTRRSVVKAKNPNFW